MNFEESFYYHWNRIERFEIPEPLDHTICVYALSFQKWVEELGKMMENPTEIVVNQVKILLTDKYFDWERLVPQSHRQHQGAHGHTCIYQVFKKGYENLRIVELSLTPPLISYPPPVIPPPKPIIGGLFIGEGSNNEPPQT